MNLKEFYQIGKDELTQLYGEEPQDYRLEQVERIGDTDDWEVVVSYLVENKNRPEKLAIRIDYQYERVYKAFRVNSKKEVIGFYMFNKAS